MVGLVQVGVEWVCKLRTDFLVNIWDYKYDGMTRGRPWRKCINNVSVRQKQLGNSG